MADGVVFLPEREKPKILGVNTRFYPGQASILGHEGFWMGAALIDQTENPPPTRAVLVAGDIGDYACYVGHGDAEWVARHGDKVSFAEAKAQFPAIEREKYRG